MKGKYTQKRKMIHRSVSLAVALVMFLSETYIWSILDNIPFREATESETHLAAHAEETGNDPDFPHDDETTNAIRVPLEDFKEYADSCQIYSTYHQYDKIEIYSTGTSDLFESGFSGLGTQSKPFGGSIKIAANTDITLNLDAPLFNYVYDSVIINGGNVLSISRYYMTNGGADETTPIVARYVYHDSENSDVKTWKFDLTTPSDSTDHYLSQFGGFIGTMDDEKGSPKLNLAVSMNTATLTKNGETKSDSRAATINGNGDLGLACGHMDAGAELTFIYNANRDIAKIETSGGDVGGLVGEMEDGAVFTLKNQNAITGGIDIITKASGSYAGGLVGKNIGGTVNVYAAESAAGNGQLTLGQQFVVNAAQAEDIEQATINAEQAIADAAQEESSELAIADATQEENSEPVFADAEQAEDSEETTTDAEQTEGGEEATASVEQTESSEPATGDVELVENLEQATTDVEQTESSESTLANAEQAESSEQPQNLAPVISEQTIVMAESGEPTQVTYPIRQKITGTSGSGGVFGYYKPTAALTGDNSFDTSKYSFDYTENNTPKICQVNGTGYAGGLFGVLDATVDIIISGSGNVKSNHYAGSCTAYGGLIGQYKADSVNRTLTISSVTATPAKTGTATYYGGGIGEIESTTPTYVEFSSFTADASDAGSLTFGGLVARAEKAFVRTSGASITASSYKGGGLVGNLKNGVLQISGANTITGSSSEPGEDEELKVGKIVGYRDNGLVFKDAGASCTCGSAEVDDVGSWGGVVNLSKFATAENVIDVGTHAVTIGTSGYAFTPITNKDDFAVTALRFQIDGVENATGNPFVTFKNTTKNSSSIVSTNITMSGDADLTGTGIYGLTRDNDIGSSMAKCLYSGAFSGGSKKITFDTGTIYRHKYNGLFAKLNGGTVQNVEFAGKIDVNAKTDMYVGTAAARATGDFTANSVTVNTDMDYAGSENLYLGGILGEADSSIGAINVTSCTVNANIGIKSDNSNCSNSKAVLGGVVGQISHKADAAKTWNFKTVNVSGEIRNAGSGKIGGLVSVILGGYSGNEQHRILNLNGVTIDGLMVSGGDATSMGGLLGYSWLKTDVNVGVKTTSGTNTTITSVTVQDKVIDSSTSKKPTVSNSGAGGIGGMVYRATGKWTVTSLDIKDIAVSGTGSVGMIVNKGISHDDANFYTDSTRSAIYLCLPSGYTYNIASSTLPSVAVFDELCAYTAPDEDSVLKNENGIISINEKYTDTSTNSLIENKPFKTNGSSPSGSYHARTAKGASANPNSRYYYNLDTLEVSASAWSTKQTNYQNALTLYNEYNALTEEEAKTAYLAEHELTDPPTLPSLDGRSELMNWGLNQYACANLKQYFVDVFGSTITDANYNMADYSWYPVDLDKSITVNGTFKFYSHELELSEDAKKTAENAVNSTLAYDRTNEITDIDNPIKTQHYIMHCGLFRNVASGKKLTIGATVFQGNVGLIDSGDGSGALICGTAQGASNTSKVTIEVSDSGSVSLDGVYVYGAASSANYAPLLINKVGSYVDLTMKNVSSTGYLKASYTTNSPYIAKDGNGFPKAASSLIGDVGLSDTPTGINVTFSNIKLDGRTADVTDSTHNGVLDTVYGSNRTIFTRSTLLNQFKYVSGSTGRYNYTSEEDWSNSSHAGLGVTYGKEVGYTVSDTNTEYPGKEQNYSGSQYFTNPITPLANATYEANGVKFNNFLPYVFTAYNSTNKTHQLRVNHGAATATGCGTYNDPYILSDGLKIEAFCDWINNAGFNPDDKILIPTANLTTNGSEITKIGQTNCSGTAHEEFKYNNTNFVGAVSGKTISTNVMRTYLASAYYQIPEEIGTITIPTSDNPLHDFTGLGNTDKDFAVFRGVIDGNGKTIINNTDYPLIERSNGSVVKDLTIEVKPSSGISLTGTKYAFDSAVEGEPANAAYGAVMAKIFGGDNIIDNVSLAFGTSTNKANISLTGTAQLVPVGGYVGVIVNGGLYFRNMKRIDENKNAIHYDESLFTNVSFSATANDATDSAPMSDSNMEWLYVNPIVGRVINGFAVTESFEIKETNNGVETITQRNAYRPYENGSRTYKGGTTDDVRYWDEANQTEVTTAPASLSHVTMQNGNKHYSIVDISSTLGKLTTGTTPVGVPNGQALFIMSAIVNSGMSNQSLGYSRSAVGSNNNFYVSRSNANYKYVGKIPTAPTAPTIPADQTDAEAMAAYETALAAYNSALAEYNAATSDYGSASTDGTAIRGYLMTEYTTGATDISGANNKTVKLTTADGKYYLPDGFKGIGNLYQNDDKYRMKITTFTGNGATISQNTSFYCYFANDYNVFDTNYTPSTNVGVGLINYQPVNISAEKLKLTGNVIADIIDSSSSSGAHLKYKVNHSDYNNLPYANNDKLGIDNQNKASVGSFIGYARGTDISTDDVVLNNVYVKGMKSTGGLLGTPDGGITTITATNYDFDKIKVHGASCTGGLIGMKYQGGLSVDLNEKNFNLTEVECLCEQVTNLSFDANYGVGGIIGLARSDQYDANKPGLENSIIKNINLGAADQDTNISIKCKDAQLFTGGLVGTITRTNVDIENCHFYNLNIESNYYAGGAIGHLATAPNRGRNFTNNSNTKASEIINVTFEKSSSANATSWIDSTGNSAGGLIGAAKGDLIKDINIDSCMVKDCSISSLNYTGGMIGVIGYAANDNQLAHNVNITNSSVTDCALKANDSIGGLVGVINYQHQAKKGDAAIYLKGYNILAENLKFEPYTSGRPLFSSTTNPYNSRTNTNGVFAGYICGYNEKAIQIAGFSRQDDQIPSTMIPDLVGRCSSSDSNIYGEKTYSNVTTTGYVIFADYADEASTVQNKKFANMVLNNNDIAEYEVIGSRTTITDYKVITKKDAGGNPIVQSYTYNTRSNKFSDTVSPESVSATGTKTSYETIDASTNLTQVNTLAELTAEGNSGFYIRNQTDSNSNKYLTDTINENNKDSRLTTTNDISNAAVWHFEYDSVNGGYLMYTFATDGVTKKYLSRRVGRQAPVKMYTQAEAEAAIATQKANTSWDKDYEWDHVYTITAGAAYSDKTDGFTIALISNTHPKNTSTTQYCNFRSVSDVGLEFSNSACSVFTIWTETTTPESYKLVTEDYSSSAFAPAQGAAITGTLTNQTDATSTQSEEYASDLKGIDYSDHSYAVYTVTVTAVKNVYGYTENSKPYVTTNPKRFITDDSQFLTGDGILSAFYPSSAFKKITDDRADSANKPKAYTFYSLTRGADETNDDNAIASIKAELSNSATEFKGYSGYESSGIKNFPLLIAEDTNKETLTPIINNYLRVLTNTSYDFADTTKTAIYEVGLYKCEFKESTKEFEVDTTQACLHKTSKPNENGGTDYYFSMEASNVDTKDIPQFTLMDVQFKDPSGSGKIAYHLYVPVYVKKVLRFDFNAEIKSGTDYYWSAYTRLGKTLSKQGMFENLGNPVTIAFEYKYDRSGDDWKDAINGGDSLLTNYYKYLTLKNHNNNGWAPNTRMVLVDANNNDKYYYLDTPPTSTPTTISLFDFADDAGNHYVPVQFQDLMTVTVGDPPSGESGHLVMTGNNGADPSVIINGVSYPATVKDTTSGKNYAYVDEVPSGTTAYYVTDISDIKTERYYLSIFTKSNNDDTVYRYEISSPDSFKSSGTGVIYTGANWAVNSWRANKIDKNTVINFFTGNLYHNDLTLNVATPRQNGTLAMSASNNVLRVDMKATVALTEKAKGSGVGDNMYTFRNDAYIYQTFLMMYDKLATVGGSHEIGIDTDANAKIGINSYFYAGGAVGSTLNASNADAVTNPQDKKEVSAKYLNLRNDENIIKLLGNSSVGNAATLQVNFDMVYAADDLSAQFPTKDPDDTEQNTIGANVIGYSKISSNADTAANSATYDKKTNTNLYYTTSESTAVLKYNVEETPRSAAGRYSYLGINAVESGDDEVFVDSYAIYDTHKLTNAGKYIELTLRLSNKKEGYYVPDDTNPATTGKGTPLPIGRYISDLEIYGADGSDADEKDDVIFKQSESAISTDVRVTTKDEKIYKVRVNKELLKTQADGIYVIPIKFKVKTGNTLFNSNDGGLTYSNYKISLTAGKRQPIPPITKTEPGDPALTFNV